MTPHFATAVREAGGDVHVAVFERGGAPVGFFPYQFANSWRAMLRSAEPVGGAMADAFGPVLAPDSEIAEFELLQLAGLSTCDFHHLQGAPSGLSAEESEPGLRIDWQGDWPKFWEELAERNKKFVQKTERRQRNLVKEFGELRFEVHPSTATDVLRDLIERKRAQYQRTNVPDALAENWKRTLLERLLATGHETCRGMLCTLHAGDEWVATHFGLLCGDVLHYWFPVYGTSVSKHSPGHLLIKILGEHASEHGIRAIDRGAGDTQAKRSFANVEQSFGRGRWSRSGVRSSVFRVTQSIAWRLQKLGRGD